jgi:hypothetical protein
MSNPYEVGDRITIVSDPKLVNADFAGLSGEVTKVYDEVRLRVQLDKKDPPTSDPEGWQVNVHQVNPEEGVISENEINALFGIGLQPPSVNSTPVELLQHIDNALRNNTKLSRANLAFEFLLKSMDLTRLDLPTYVHDMQEE